MISDEVLVHDCRGIKTEEGELGTPSITPSMRSLVIVAGVESKLG